jgi:septal ring factor EnvC (AmiA/AmiB activator)
MIILWCIFIFVNVLQSVAAVTVEDLSNQFKDFEVANRDLKTRLDNQLDTMSNNIEDLKRTVEHLNEENNKKNGQIQTLKQEDIRMSAKLQTLELEIANLKSNNQYGLGKSG